MIKSFFKKAFPEITLFFILLFILLAFLGKPIFCDEADVFLGGKTVADGGMIYQRFITQHNPLSYYIAAVFSVLGAKNYYLFRLFSYAFVSALWTFVYTTFKKIFNSKVLYCFPILFVIVLANFDWGYSMISEQFFAVGAVILFLQFYKYYNTKEMSVWDCIRISFAVFLAFGATFIAAYTVAWVALSYFVFQLYLLVSAKKENKFNNKYFGRIVKSTSLLVGIIMIPFVILGGYYLICGNIKNAIYGAVSFNREIYSKYTEGFGTSALSPVLTSINGFASCISGGFDTMIHTDFAVGFSTLVRYFAVIFVIVKLIFKKQYGFALFTFGFFLSMSTRGHENFHSIQTVAVSVLFFTYILFEFIGYAVEENKSAATKNIAITLVAVSLIVITLPFLKTCDYNTNYYSLLKGNAISRSAKVLDLVTSESEKVHICTLDIEPVLNSHRNIDISGASTTPWTYEGFGKSELEQVTKEPTVVVIVDFEQNVWGYTYKDYAPEMVEFVEENYTNLCDNVWVRNDRIEKAKATCEKAGLI